MHDPTLDIAPPPAPIDPRPAILGLAQKLAERLAALPAEALGATHTLRLARALSLDLVDLLGAGAPPGPH